MIITLIDGGKEFQELELREYGNSRTLYCQTGFTKLKRCCVSRYLICRDGRVYGRIATELVPAGVYNGLEYEIKNDYLNKRFNALIKELQAGA